MRKAILGRNEPREAKIDGASTRDLGLWCGVYSMIQIANPFASRSN